MPPTVDNIVDGLTRVGARLLGLNEEELKALKGDAKAEGASAAKLLLWGILTLVVTFPIVIVCHSAAPPSTTTFHGISFIIHGGILGYCTLNGSSLARWFRHWDFGVDQPKEPSTRLRDLPLAMTGEFPGSGLGKPAMKLSSALMWWMMVPRSLLLGAFFWRPIKALWITVHVLDGLGSFVVFGIVLLSPSAITPATAHFFSFHARLVVGSLVLTETVSQFVAWYSGAA